jgi:ankyrin repeat protein
MATSLPGVDIFSAAAFGESETLVALLAQLRACGEPNPALLRDAYGSTILIEASKLGDIATCNVALREGADVQACDAMGRNALHWAAGGGLADTVNCLLSAGASPSAVDAKGETPMHLASRGGHDRIVAALISHGGDASAPGALAWLSSFPARGAAAESRPSGARVQEVRGDVDMVSASAAGESM